MSTANVQIYEKSFEKLCTNIWIACDVRIHALVISGSDLVDGITRGCQKAEGKPVKVVASHFGACLWIIFTGHTEGYMAVTAQYEMQMARRTKVMMG